MRMCCTGLTKNVLKYMQIQKCAKQGKKGYPNRKYLIKIEYLYSPLPTESFTLG